MQVRCPHCQSPIEVVENDSLDDLECESCGSHFSLVSDETLSFGGEFLRSVAHFQLVDQLGVGAFGAVYKANDTQLQRTVAVKLPRKSNLSGEESEKFLREARAAAQLKHPNIVGVHEVGRDNESIYIVSDFVQGADLKQWLERGALSLRESALLCQKLALALHHAHESGVVHRDLKPGNIMIDLQGEPHITDFGLAKREAGEITMTVDGQILGTPAYMSPEQARGDAHQADRRSDIYSLGVILFQLLTNELPFRGRKQMLIVQILEDEPPQPRRLNRLIPKDLETICLKCLEKPVVNRYTTAKDLSNDLGRWLEGQPVLARPIPLTEKAWRWCRKRPALTSLSGLFLLSLVLGMVGVVWQWREAVGFAKEATLAEGRALDNEAEARSLASRELEAKQQLAKLLYSSSVVNAGNEFGKGDIELARDYLKRAKDLNSKPSFEWFLLRQLCGYPQATLEIEAGELQAFSYSHDSRWFAYANSANKVQIGNAQTNELEFELLQSETPITDIQFSPLASLLAVAFNNGEVQLWNVRSRSLSHQLVGCDASINDLVFSPDGTKLVAAAGDIAESIESENAGEVRIWNVETGETEKVFGNLSKPIRCVSFSSDGKRLAAAAGNKVLAEGDGSAKIKVWDTANFQQVSEIEAVNGGQLSIVFQPKTHVLIGQGFESQASPATMSLGFWDVDTGRELQRLKLGLDVPGATINSPQGDRLATGGVGKVRLWAMGAGTMRLERTLYTDSRTIEHLAFSPDGRRIITGEVDEQDTLEIWEVEPRTNPIMLTEHEGWVQSVAYSNDGKWLATGERRRQPKANSRVMLFWRDDLSVERVIEFPEIDIEEIAFSNNGEKLAVACDDGTIRLYRVDDMELEATLKSRNLAVTQLCFGPDDQTLITADGEYRRMNDDGSYYDEFSKAGEIRVWDISSREIIRTLSQFSDAITGIALAPNGENLAVTTRGGKLSIWDWQNGERIQEVQCYDYPLTAVAFNPIGPSLAVSGAQGNIQIFSDLNNLEEPVSFRADRVDIRAMIFSPDGKALVTGTFSGSLRFWDSETGYEKLRLPAKQIISLAFAPDGKSLAAGSTSRQTQLWWYD